jgi:flagellar protein FlaG
MTNLDSLQSASNQLPSQAAGSRAPNRVSVEANSTANLVTPSGNVLPPQAKPAPQSAIQRQQPAEQPVDIEAVATKLSEFASSLQRALTFSVDDDTGQTVIVVTDSESDQIVRQIPSEELLELARKLQDLQEQQEQLHEATGNLLEVRV